MDSRIREIEQWIEQAKTGLHDGGRDEYVKKLYLLDAEIRAVIKESGDLPGVNYSPGRRRGGARHSSTRLITAGAVAGVLLLAAAAAWFANPVTTRPRQAESMSIADAAAAQQTMPVAPLKSHIPGSITGEEVILARWIAVAPPRAVDAASNDVPAGKPLQELASSKPVLDIGPALKAEQGAPPLLPAPMHVNSASAVILTAGVWSPTGSGLQMHPAILISGDAQGTIPPGSEKGVISAAADRYVSVDIVDNTNPQDQDEVDKLDPDALKRNVEKHFTK